MIWDQLPGEPSSAYAHFLDWLRQPKRPILALWCRPRKLTEKEANELHRRWAWEQRRCAWEVHLGALYFKVASQQTALVAEALVEASHSAVNMAKLLRRKTIRMNEQEAIDLVLEDSKVPQFARVVGRLTRDLDRTGLDRLDFSAPDDASGVDLSKLSDEELDQYRALLEKAAV